MWYSVCVCIHSHRRYVQFGVLCIGHSLSLAASRRLYTHTHTQSQVCVCEVTLAYRFGGRDAIYNCSLCHIYYIVSYVYVCVIANVKVVIVFP